MIVNVNKEVGTDFWTHAREHPVFSGITDSDVSTALPFFDQIRLDPGELLIAEGQDTTLDLYIVLTGSLKVARRAGDNANDQLPWIASGDLTVATLRAGDSFGELGFVKGNVRSASIRGASSSRLLGLNPASFSRLEESYPRIASRLMKNLLGSVGERLKLTTDNEIRALKNELHNSLINSKANLFFSYVIALLCVYNLAIQTMINLSLDTNRASIISAIIILVFAGVLALMIRQSGLPAFVFGLTTRKWQQSIKECMALTTVIVGVLITVKWILVTYVPRYQHLPVFDFDMAHTRYLAFNFLLYGLHSPIQEFIARGVLQGSLQHFFKGKHVTARAILISNALFSATHVHLLGGLLGVIVFVPGLFWGWLYSRHENLIGVSVSHVLIGWTALFFLNIESLF